MAISYNPANCVISVSVSDYDRSLAWYREVLGFDLDYELKEYGWCELTTPFGFRIGLGQTETVVTPGNVTPTFGVPDMVRLSTFYDPDGTPWMLAQTLVPVEA